MPVKIGKPPLAVMLACTTPLAFLAFSGCERSTTGKAKTVDLLIFRVPAITLETTPVTSTETIVLQKEDRLSPLRIFANSDSKLEVEATYCHRIELRNTWSFVIDPDRGDAFIIMPDLTPTSPVEFKITRNKKIIAGFDVDSSWFWRFEDRKQIKERMELLKKLQVELGIKASSSSILTLRVGEARSLVASHIRDWLIREGHCKADSRPVVKVFFKNESHQFPLPVGAVLADFSPEALAVE